MSYATHVSKKVTPQSQPIPGTKQVKNSASGFAWKVDCWTRLDRFLILGSEKGFYYASERELTIQNADCILECAQADAARTINRIVEISDGGRAPKNDPAIFALALIAGEKGDAGKAALDAMPKVCRIGTHLFQFIEAIKARRGFGRKVREAVAAWYLDKTPEALAYQVTKYQQRNGWSHKDVLRLCHAPSNTALMRWIVGASNTERNVKRGEVVKNYEAVGELPALVVAMEESKSATSDTEIVRLIESHGLVRECIPTQFLNSPKVWNALLQNMPVTAMVRNLGKMSAIGLVAPMSDAARLVCERLADVDRLKKGRVHPLSMLVAQKIYAQGRGDKGSLSWMPVPQVIDALDEAFYSAFQAVEPTGKRWFLGLDVSGSMCSPCSGTPIQCREAVGALALVTARTERQYVIAAFSSGGWQCGRGQYSHMGYGNGIETVDFSRVTRLDHAMSRLAAIRMGGTDCALPMLYAKEHKIPVDVFCVYTDSETWAGNIHPSQALQQYRQAMGINAKLVVLGMAANEFSIADPNDGGMLDVVGFDTSVPQVMAEFARA